MRVLGLVLTLVIASSSAMSQDPDSQIGEAPFSGNDLLKECDSQPELPQTDQIYHQLMCREYLRGVLDVLGIIRSGYFAKIRPCVPHHVNSIDLQIIMIPYLKSHSEERRLPMVTLTMRALAENFPCPS